MIKLMHVEDDADIREITMLSLALSGDFDVLQVESGDDALAQIDAFGPDVLLIDMMMPGMTGVQLLELVRQKPAFASVPAIFMTARAQNSDREMLMASGATAVISKPFEPASLGDQVKAALARASDAA